MFNIVDKYMQNLTKNDVNNFALKKNINLADDELDLIYNFVKKNYKEILKNPTLFDINRFESKFHGDNFTKIKKVYLEYFSKYQKFL